MLYVLTVDGFVISEPMTIEELTERFGEISKLKTNGIEIKKIKN